MAAMFSGHISYTANGLTFMFGVSGTQQEVNEAMPQIYARVTEAVKKTGVPAANNSTPAQAANPQGVAQAAGNNGGIPRPNIVTPPCLKCNSNVQVQWISGKRRDNGQAFGFFKCDGCKTTVREPRNGWGAA